MSQVVRLQNQHIGVLELVQRHYPEYHPVLAMVRLAHDDRVTADPRLEFEVHKAVAPYCVPKLASVEVKPPQEASRVIVSLFEDMQLEDGTTVEVEVPLVREALEVVPLDS
jgi:hypothetical protein